MRRSDNLHRSQAFTLRRDYRGAKAIPATEAGFLIEDWRAGWEIGSKIQILSQKLNALPNRVFILYPSSVCLIGDCFRVVDDRNPYR